MILCYGFWSFAIVTSFAIASPLVLFPVLILQRLHALTERGMHVFLGQRPTVCEFQARNSVFRTYAKLPRCISHA